MRRIRLAFTLGLLLISTAVGASDFCTGLEILMKHSITGFDELPTDFTLEGVGVGRKGHVSFYHSIWLQDFSFKSKEDAIDKYNELVNILSNCQIQGSPLTCETVTGDQLHNIDRVRMCRWKLPETHMFNKIYVQIDIEPTKKGNTLHFEVINATTT